VKRHPLGGFFLLMKIDFLYKYRVIDARTLRILVCNELYFASPDSFNDPFDCNIVPAMQATREEMENFCRKQFPDLPEQKYQELVENNLKGFPEHLSKSLRNDLDEMRMKLSLSCFSQVNNSSLMFSHYADGHKGLCLEFKVIEHPFFDALLPVEYPDQFPSLSFFGKDLQGMMNAQLLTKQPEWKYEKEYRIVKVDDPANYQKFPPEALTGIIFGLRTSDADITLIRELTSHRKPKLRFYKSVKLDGSFDLKIIQI
jgi:Protein of unknown function (DUF2971)